MGVCDSEEIVSAGSSRDVVGALCIARPPWEAGRVLTSVFSIIMDQR